MRKKYATIYHTKQRKEKNNNVNLYFVFLSFFVLQRNKKRTLNCTINEKKKELGKEREENQKYPKRIKANRNIYNTPSEKRTKQIYNNK